ncbi:MAG TPA: hypothetical protein VK962_07945 [Actinomycetota bacterium]|nr:hypothetical protein [Actinomycetota bacterium]
MNLPDRLVALRQRAEPIVRDFEWTWTTAVLASLALAFFSMITMVVMPSAWMYIAEQQFGWGGPSGTGDWWLELRDAVAMGLTTGPFVTVLVLAVLMQNWRRRLRGRTGDSRPTGGYR